MPHIEIALSVPDGSTASVATIRSHEITVDRPEAKGGGDAGPMGGELLLAALGGCFASTLVAAAIGRNLELGDARIVVVGELSGGSPARFEAIALTLEVGGEVSDDDLDHLALVTERGCIVANTLRPAVNLTVAATSGSSSGG